MATCGRDRPTACFAFDGVNFTRRNILAFRIKIIHLTKVTAEAFNDA
jgi:hypothetical protein